MTAEQGAGFISPLAGRKEDCMHTPLNFEHLLGLSGFSDQLLKNHFVLYQGYVKHVNDLDDKLRELRGAQKANTPDFAELKRRYGWEWNGMRLHELYFSNLTREEILFEKSVVDLAKELERQFGSTLEWVEEFKAVGAMRGVGWAILYYDVFSKRFSNVWVNEHDVGHLVGAVPLLVMDVWEHAYMLDYGIKRADYIAAFMKAVDWKVVEARFEAARK